MEKTSPTISNMAWQIYLIILLGIHKEEQIMAQNNHQTNKGRRKDKP
jgi:hypothetical protein